MLFQTCFDAFRIWFGDDDNSYDFTLCPASIVGVVIGIIIFKALRGCGTHSSATSSISSGTDRRHDCHGAHLTTLWMQTENCSPHSQKVSL